MASIRIYVTKGCPHCEAVKEFFASKKIPTEVIEIGFDPILQAGMRALSSNGTGLPVPLIVSFATQEVFYGNDPEQLQRVADSFSASASDTATEPGEGIRSVVPRKKALAAS
jgi:glutaredoxin